MFQGHKITIVLAIHTFSCVWILEKYIKTEKKNCHFYHYGLDYKSGKDSVLLSMTDVI